MFKVIFIIVGIGLVIILEILWRKKHRFDINKTIQIGKLLFESKRTRFEEYVNTYKTNKHNFKMIYVDDFSGIDDIKEMTSLDFILLFGDYADEILTIDWRGEENEGEIQKWCEEKLGHPVNWTQVENFRKEENNTSIESLIKTINSDLNQINYSLIVFDSANDSFELAVISNKNLKTIKELNKKLIKN